MGAPLEMPPWMPPELLVLVVRRGGPLAVVVLVLVLGVGAGMKASLWMEPGTSQPPKPEPISNPLVAGMLSMAWASMASSLSKQGSPSPMGVLRITHVTVPPMLSFASRKAAIFSAMRADASVLGQRTGRKVSTSARVIFERSSRYRGFVAAVGWAAVGGNRCSSPTEETKETISTP